MEFQELPPDRFSSLEWLHCIHLDTLRSEFSRRVIRTCGIGAPNPAHSPDASWCRLRLDENEAFESEVAGLIDAIRSLDFPRILRRLS